MAGSFITPVNLQPNDAWNWNPAATFIAAYNSAAENKREQEKLELDAWMTRTLLPYKQQVAQLELQKLQQDVEFRSLAMKKVGEYDRERHANRMRLLNDTPTTGTVRRGGLFSRLSASEEARMASEVDDAIMLPEP